MHNRPKIKNNRVTGCLKPTFDWRNESFGAGKFWFVARHSDFCEVEHQTLLNYFFFFTVSF